MRLARLRPRRAQTVDDLKQERSSGDSSDKSSVGAAIKVSDPHCEHIMIENGNRPRVAKTMRGSRFPKNRRRLVRICAAHFGPWQVNHFQRQECGFRHDDRTAWRSDWIARCAAKRTQLAVIRER